MNDQSKPASGFTLLESLVAVFILATLTTAIAGVATLGTKTAIVNEQRVVAQQIASEKAELLRVIPYPQIGYVSPSPCTGSVCEPDGIIERQEIVERNNGHKFTVNTFIQIKDDPLNGTETVTPLTEENADFKKVIINVSGQPSAGTSVTSAASQVAFIAVPQTDKCADDSECGIGEACCDTWCQVAGPDPSDLCKIEVNPSNTPTATVTPTTTPSAGVTPSVTASPGLVCDCPQMSETCLGTVGTRVSWSPEVPGDCSSQCVPTIETYVCGGGVTDTPTVTPTGSVDPSATVTANASPSSSPKVCEPGYKVISTAGDHVKIVSVYDLDSDGDDDVLSASDWDNEVAWMENDGNANFVRHIITTEADDPRGVVLGDLDADGDVDIVTGSNDDNEVAWMENDGSENFTRHIISTEGNRVVDIVVMDIDGDGDLDILSSSSMDDELAWMENDGSANFARHIINSDGLYELAVSDLDGDGDIDILAAPDNQITWLENDGSENFTSHVIKSIYNLPRGLNAVDVDEDGDIDLVIGSRLSNDVAWMENDGNENFTYHLLNKLGYGIQDVVSTDLDGDGDIDIASVSMFDDEVAWMENDGSENFTRYIIANQGDHPVSMAVGDLDGDGYLDIVSGSDVDDKVGWTEVCPGEIASPLPSPSAGASIPPLPSPVGCGSAISSFKQKAFPCLAPYGDCQSLYQNCVWIPSRSEYRVGVVIDYYKQPSAMQTIWGYWGSVSSTGYSSGAKNFIYTWTRAIMGTCGGASNLIKWDPAKIPGEWVANCW